MAIYGIAASYFITCAQLCVCVLFGGFFETKRALPVWGRAASIFFLALLPTAAGFIQNVAVNALVALLTGMAVLFVWYGGSVTRRILAALGFFGLGLVFEIAIFFFFSTLTATPVEALTGPSPGHYGLQLLGVFAVFAVVCAMRGVGHYSKNKSVGVRYFPEWQLLAVLLVGMAMSMYILYSILLAPRLATVGIFIFIGLVVADALALFAAIENRKKAEAARELEAMKAQEALTASVIREQQAHLEDMASQTHEYKNSLLAIRAIYEDGAAPGSQAGHRAVDEALFEVGRFVEFSDVANGVLRAILYRTRAQCKKAGIRFSARVEYSDFSFIPFGDLSTLLNNPIQNAVEACMLVAEEDDRALTVTIFRQADVAAVTILNAKENEVIEDAGRFCSTKTEARRHGLGLRNMERIAKKYGGHAVVAHERTAFSVRLMIPIPLT